MASFITIGYGDRAGYDRTAAPLRDAAHAHDERLRSSGALMGVAGAPVCVRNHEAQGVRVENGPFLAARLPVAGFAVIEAASLQEAIALVAQTPCAVAYGVVEVWPLQTFDLRPEVRVSAAGRGAAGGSRLRGVRGRCRPTATATVGAARTRTWQAPDPVVLA